jgi:hypothetical protein
MLGRASDNRAYDSESGPTRYLKEKFPFCPFGEKTTWR